MIEETIKCLTEVEFVNSINNFNISPPLESVKRVSFPDGDPRDAWIGLTFIEFNDATKETIRTSTFRMPVGVAASTIRFKEIYERQGREIKDYIKSFLETTK